MKIHNVRLGHATNSSSSHSLVFLSNIADKDADGEFNWNHFTLASKSAKSRYLAVALAHALRNQTTPEIAKAVIDAWLPNNGREEGDGIDHQSMPSLPRDWSGLGVDKAFFDAYRDYLLREGVVVLGGNDNDDNGHPLSCKEITSIPADLDTKHLVCRKDGEHWTLFDRQSGAKVRLSLKDSPAPHKAISPELCDIKITNFCPYNCQYCYMDSTPKGKHADTGILRNLAERLGDMKVFEVALGGGDPTFHPDFIQILEAFRRNGVVPNFTTRNLSWLSDPIDSQRILAVTGAFAVSVDKGAQVRKLVTLLKANGHESILDRQKVHVQYVVGSGDLHGVLQAAAEERITLTLLGYKTDGRGGAFDPSKYERDTWLRTTKDVSERMQKQSRYLQIGVDTALIQSAGKEALEAAGIHESLYTKREGAFSCYIDAVEKTIAPASYGCSEKTLPLPEFRGYDESDKDPILAAFAEF